MRKLLLFIYTGLLFIGLSSQQSKDDLLEFVPARVVGVKNGADNPYFAAVKDDTSPSGWAIQVKKNFTRYEIDNYFLAYMFDTISSGDKYGDVHTVLGAFLCDLIIFDSRYDMYPKNNNMGRDIMKLILPERQGSCDFTEGTNPIMPSTIVNIAEYDNPKVKFPNSSYYELFVNILSQDLRQNLEKGYYFQVKLMVGKPPSTGYICFERQWNYYIVWRLCTFAEFIDSIIFGVGKRILHSIF